MRPNRMYTRSAIRAFAGKVTALGGEQLELWRRPLPMPPPASGERSEQCWEGEGGNLGAPARPKLKS